MKRLKLQNANYYFCCYSRSMLENSLPPVLLDVMRYGLLRLGVNRPTWRIPTRFPTVIPILKDHPFNEIVR